MPGKSTKPFRLGDETFGEKVRRSYYRGKAMGRYANWDELATAIRHVRSISAPGLQRLMTLKDKPTRDGPLETAWLLCIAIGVDPADWGLSKSEIASPMVRSVTSADLGLKPCSRFAGTAA